MAVKESLLPSVMVLKDVHRPFFLSPTRKANYRFGLAEACWILSGSDDAQLIGKFNKNMLKFSDDGKTLWGAYGPRLMGQMPHVLNSLRRDGHSRQAVSCPWRPQVGPLELYGMDIDWRGDHRDSLGLTLDPNNQNAEWDGDSWRSKDIPCTIFMHFQMRDGKLCMTAYMRSNDAYLGVPYDILSFTTVQRAIASALGAEPGWYCHVASNLHLYERNFEDAERALKDTSGVDNQVELPPMGRALYGTLAPQISRVFEDIFDETLGACEHHVDWIKPFVAAMHRRPDVWDGWPRLLRATGRKPRVVATSTIT